VWPDWNRSETSFKKISRARQLSAKKSASSSLKSLGKSTEPLHTVLLTGSTVMSAAATSVTARVGAVASTACARVTHAAAAPRPRVAVARKSVSAIAFRRRRGDAHVTRAGKKKPGDAANDVANMDALIDNLIAADEESLVKLVAENVLSFDQSLWIRIASRSDSAPDQHAKDGFMTLAGKCMKLIEEMVEKTESGIQQSSKTLEKIVAVAADPVTGEFAVPLSSESVTRMRFAVNETAVDEQMLNTVYAWIRKSDEDKLDGMVHIMQHLLQCYAARELDTGKTPLDTVIGANAGEWREKFEAAIAGGFGEEAFTRDLQKRMEGVVLNLPNGSYAQRVQAEYLKEVEDRGKGIYAEKSGASAE
jgi:hypothetical protein